MDPNATIKLDIRAELTKALYNTYPVSLISTFLIASLILFELSGPIRPEYLRTWYLTFCGVSIGQFILCKWYFLTQSRIELQALHYYLFLIGAFLTAGLWGILSSYLMPPDLLHQTFILIIISGILAGSIQSLSPSYLCSITYLLLIMIPLLIWQAVQILAGTRIYISIATLMVTYCIFSMIVTYHIHNLLINHIRLKFENEVILKNLSHAKYDLEEANKNLKYYSNQIELLSRMGEVLKLCVTEEEILNISIKFISQILSFSSGGIFLISKANRVRAFKTWGTIPIETLNFSVDDCWAMRHQQIHLTNSVIRCQHSNKSDDFYQCIPLKTHNEILGVVYILKPEKAPFNSSEQNLLARIANDISLTISEIKYSELLKNQAMHDPLTGLFNRRFLDEYFETEIKRAARKKTLLAIIMLDIDHFKRFNDNFGHDMGDSILRELGDFLINNVRSGDIVCRYGGEEFIIIMPDSSLEIAYERAELLRTAAKNLSNFIKSEVIKSLSFSFGIAIYPDNGLTPESLIHEADKALYEAKQTGRDRICIAKKSSI